MQQPPEQPPYSNNPQQPYFNNPQQPYTDPYTDPYSNPGQPMYQPPYQQPNYQQTDYQQPYFNNPQQPYPYGVQMQPAKKRGPGCLIASIITVVVVIALIAVAALANNVRSTATTTNTNQTSQASQSGNTQSGKMGDAQTISGWTVKLNSAKTSTGSQFDKLQNAGDIFLEINITATNNTGKAQPFSSFLNLALKDSNGQKYSETFVSDASLPPDGNVSNGSKLTGTASYEVPKSINSFELDFLPDLITGGTNQVSWTFSV